MLGEEAIRTDRHDLLVHGVSEWSSINADRLPGAVAYPKSTEDVSHIAKICHKHRVPMSASGPIQGLWPAPDGR